MRILWEDQLRIEQSEFNKGRYQQTLDLLNWYPECVSIVLDMYARQHPRNKHWLYDAGDGGNCGPLCIAAILKLNSPIYQNLTHTDVRQHVATIRNLEPKDQDWFIDQDLSAACSHYRLRLHVISSDPDQKFSRVCIDPHPISLMTGYLFHDGTHFQVLRSHPLETEEANRAGLRFVGPFRVDGQLS